MKPPSSFDRAPGSFSNETPSGYASPSQAGHPASEPLLFDDETSSAYAPVFQIRHSSEAVFANQSADIGPVPSFSEGQRPTTMVIDVDSGTPVSLASLRGERKDDSGPFTLAPSDVDSLFDPDIPFSPPAASANSDNSEDGVELTEVDLYSAEFPCGTRLSFIYQGEGVTKFPKGSELIDLTVEGVVLAWDKDGYALVELCFPEYGDPQVPIPLSRFAADEIEKLDPEEGAPERPSEPSQRRTPLMEECAPEIPGKSTQGQAQPLEEGAPAEATELARRHTPALIALAPPVARRRSAVADILES